MGVEVGHGHHQLERPGRGFFEGRFGRWLLPGVILQSVLIGGGYATGREIVEFGAKFGALGWIAGLAIFAGFALMAFLMLEMARRFQVFDYRNLLRILIGPLYWLFDIVYIMLAILIIAIMAAATGAILQQTVGTPQFVGIVLIVVVVGLLNFYGEGVIARFKTIGTVMLFAGYILFATLVITRHWDAVGETLRSGTRVLEPEASLWWVVWTGILYVGYNLAVYPASLFTAHRQTRLRDTAIAGLIAGVLMTVPWFLTYFALMGFYPDTSVFDADVPWLEMLGAEAAWVLVVFGVVVGWTLIETATGMIYALVARVSQNLVDAERPPLTRRNSGIIAVATLLLALLLAQVGIIDLVAKGYTAMAYAMIAVFAVPLLVRGTYLIVRKRGHAHTTPTDFHSHRD
ncbi:YkvI family membrane protein [Mycolicibacterium thermoresistibile]